MRVDPFEGWRAKLNRAKFHLAQLTTEVAAGEKQGLYGITTCDDSKTGECVIKASLPQDLFIHYSILAGEVVHQARSSLDHLIWQLIIQSHWCPAKISEHPIRLMGAKGCGHWSIFRFEIREGEKWL